jgi:hypothetical protein
MPRTAISALAISSSVPSRSSSVDSSPETKCSDKEMTTNSSVTTHSPYDGAVVDPPYSAFLVLSPTPLSSITSAFDTIIGVGNPSSVPYLSPSPYPNSALKRLLIALAAIHETCCPMIDVTSVRNGSISSSGGWKGRHGRWVNIPAKRGSMVLR